MTTASIAWETAFAPGFDGVVCVLIEGVPVVLVPAGCHPTTTAITAGTLDPLWWPGVGTLFVTEPGGAYFDPVKEWLDMASTWTTRETTRPVDGDVECEPLRFDLFDPDGEATALLSASSGRVARLLAADITAAATSIPLDSAIGVPAFGTMHIGREAVGYGGVSGGGTVSVSGTGSGRGLYGSTARAHVVGGGTRRAPVVLGRYPRYWTGRRVAVFLCQLDGTTLRDPTLVHLGTVGAGVSLAANLMRWQIPADPITAMLSRKFAKVSIRAFGWQYQLSNTLMARFAGTGGDNTLGPTDGDPLAPGWSPTTNHFLEQFRLQGAALAIPKYSERVGNGVRVRTDISAGAQAWLVIAPWRDVDGIAAQGVSENLDATIGPLPECVMYLNGEFTVLGPGDWDRLPSTIYWTGPVGTAAGWAQPALVSDTDHAKKVFGVIVSRNATTRTFVLSAERRPGVSSRRLALITKPTDVLLGVVARGDTALAALRALGVATDEIQGNDASEVAVDWAQIARVFSNIPLSIPEGRVFHFTAADDSLLTPLIHECRLRGAALCIRRGRVGAYRPAYFARTEGTRRAIVEEDLLPDVPVEVVDGLEPVATAVKFTFSDDISYIWRDITSAEEFGEGKTITCKALESAPDVNPLLSAGDLQRVGQQLLGVLAQPTRILRIVVGPSFWNLDAGDLVTLTHSAIPTLRGTRGVTAATCQVMEKRLAFGGGQCRVQLALLLSDDAALAGYAPSALVGEIVGTAVTMDLGAAWGDNGFCLDVDANDNAVTGQPLRGFAAQDRVQLSELNAESPIADEFFVIISLTATTVTLDATPTAAMIARAAVRYGCLLRFSPWTNAAVKPRQRDYLYIADPATELLGGADAPKRWA